MTKVVIPSGEFLVGECYCERIVIMNMLLDSLVPVAQCPYRNESGPLRGWVTYFSWETHKFKGNWRYREKKGQRSLPLEWLAQTKSKLSDFH